MGPTYNPYFIPKTQTQQQQFPPPTGPPPPILLSFMPHPNQPGVFPGCGMPMELEKAQAAGICRVCKKPWLCPDHSPHPHYQIRGVTFNGQEISREMFGVL